jgi:hypothetical protein
MEELQLRESLCEARSLNHDEVDSHRIERQRL